MRDWAAFVRARLRLPGFPPERQARIVRELAAQLEDFNREALARGMTDAEADAYARRQVDDWERMASDLARADRPHGRPPLDRFADRLDALASGKRGGLTIMSNVLRDGRFAIRQLLKTPGFSIVAILTLALGIGATTAIFSVINGVLLRPLPYPDPERLVVINEIVPQYGRFSVAPANVIDWRQQATSFERLAAFWARSGTLLQGESAEHVRSAAVSWDIFELLGVPPAFGRGFAAAEDAPGNDNVIVISDGMWERRFGRDPSILGRAVTLDGKPATVIGVMPRGFYFPSRDVEYWFPLAIDPAKATRGGHYLGVIARMKRGVTLAQAGAEMKTIAERLAQQYPQNSADESAAVTPLHEAVVGEIRPALLTLFGAVAVVILIACANVANLLLVRAAVRQKEVAIRAALGAGRGRLVRQMLSESLVLALAGGALGVLLAYLTIEPLRTLSAGSIPRVTDVTIDLPVAGFALLVSLLTGIVFGLVPAWQGTRPGVSESLKEGGRSSTLSGGRWVRSGLLVAEVALSIVLLVAATLLLRSFARITSVDPGFRADRVLAFRVSVPPATYPEDHHRATFLDRLVQTLEELPGVNSAAVAQTLPLRGDYLLSFVIQGRPAPRPGEGPSANYRAITPGYFQALSIPLKRGRTFTDRDNAEKAPMVAVVDDAFVRRYFPDEDPLGQGIDIGNGTDGFFEIVGVVGDVHHDALDVAPTPTMYAPFRHDVFSTVWVLARTSGDPAQLAGPARDALRSLDRALPAFSMGPLATAVDESVAQRRFSMLLLTLFAGIAVFLAAVGLYGVVAYSVSQRTQEIGVRMAIGAQRGDVLRMIVGGGMKLAMAGVVVGVAGALALTQLVAAMLFQVTPFDPPSYGATVIVLLAVAALACYVPARRAMRVDPIVALRH